MKNKYVLTRNLNVNYLKKIFAMCLYNCMKLSRYEINEEEVIRLMENNPKETEAEIALANFKEAFEYIIENKEEADYNCLITLHRMLMKDLNDEVKSELTEDQIKELNEMINQPAKANTEIAIDCMLYILNKRLFSDGDVRVALMFANKIMIDNGCGIITISPSNDAIFREKLHQFHQGENDFKEWIYTYNIKGMRVDY